MKHLTLILIGILGSWNIARSSVQPTPEIMAVEVLSSAFNKYKRLHGKTPENWEDVAKVINLEIVNRSLVYRQSYPIQDHYAFIGTSMPFQEEDGNVSQDRRVVLIRTVPIEKTQEDISIPKKQYRYLLVQSEGGGTVFERSSEKTVQEMLARSGVNLSSKPGLPAVETDGVLLEREPKPQPNPKDVEYLKKHPELDPSKNGTGPRESTMSVSESVKAIPEAIVQIPSSKPEIEWWLILSAFIVIVTGGMVLFRMVKK